jgi:5'-3' exonuclease
MQYAAKLTNPDGEPTAHITIAFANAVKRKLLGCDDIWCWDSRDPRDKNDSKQKTLDDRAEIRRTNLDEIKRLTEELDKFRNLGKKISKQEMAKIDPTYETSLKNKEDQLAILKARNPEAQHFSNMIRDVQFLLTKLGIRMAIAPVGCDAEKLAAQLCREDMADGVLTTDTDSLAYGAPKQVKKIQGKPGKYDVYTLESCLKQHDITYKQFVEVATVLGCDFCTKTPGVGSATVIQKVKSGKIVFTDEQIEAQKRLMDHTAVKYEYFEPKCTNESLNELANWLVKKQGFNSERVAKTLKPFYV